MTEKRQLNDDEKRMATKNLEVLKNEALYLEKVDLPRVQFTLDSAELVVQKQIKAEKVKKKKLLDDLEEINNTVKELENQIANGVEIKQKKEDK